MQLFDKVDGKVTPGRGRKRILDFYLKTSTYPEIKSFSVKGSTLLPPEVLQQSTVAPDFPTCQIACCCLGSILGISFHQKRSA